MGKDKAGTALKSGRTLLLCGLALLIVSYAAMSYLVKQLEAIAPSG
jgi:hypothetical protein